MKKLSVYFGYDKNGPGKVINNLTEGLTRLGIDVLKNPSSPEGWIALLQDHNIWEIIERKDALCGPNIFVLPKDNKKFSQKFDHFVCPSQWIYDKYRTFNELSHATLDIWSVGIDTDTWKDKNFSNKKTRNVIFYTKNRNINEIKDVYEKLKKFDINIAHLHYGNYSEADLLSLCSKADACVLLTGTESQGIAYMQILSCDIPCFVLDADVWVDDLKNFSFSASSVPYFDKRCGLKLQSFNDELFENFLNKLECYSPRSYIIEEHTLVHSAKNYIKLLEKNNCKVW